GGPDACTSAGGGHTSPVRGTAGRRPEAHRSCAEHGRHVLRFVSWLGGWPAVRAAHGDARAAAVYRRSRPSVKKIAGVVVVAESHSNCRDDRWSQPFEPVMRRSRLNSGETTRHAWTSATIRTAP